MSAGEQIRADFDEQCLDMQLTDVTAELNRLVDGGEDDVPLTSPLPPPPQLPVSTVGDVAVNAGHMKSVRFVLGNMRNIAEEIGLPYAGMPPLDRPPVMKGELSERHE